MSDELGEDLETNKRVCTGEVRWWRKYLKDLGFGDSLLRAIVPRDRRR